MDLLNIFLERLQDIIEMTAIEIGTFKIKIGHLLGIALMILIGRLSIWLMRLILIKPDVTDSQQKGRKYAQYQISKYVIIALAALLSLNILGTNATLLLTSSAALLVGLGLGLQQFLNDIFSGLIMLIEGPVSVGDIIEVDGEIGRVTQIHFRTSKLYTRDQTYIILPNSKVVNGSILNWSYQRYETRFSVEVSVAYGTDVQLVIQLLEEAARSNSKVEESPHPRVSLKNFGADGLEFTLFFWSSYIFEIEFVQSEIRIEIERKFKKHDIRIPFPQRDVHINPNAS